MPDAFVPLEAFLRRSPSDEQPGGDGERPPRRTDRVAPAETIGAALLGNPSADERAEALGAVRRFRAALADAVDAACDRLVRDIAREVLVRELMLAPSDIREIVARMLERYAADAPLRLQVHPDDAAALDSIGIAVLPDAGLSRGDVVMQLRSGTIDATLDARLECVLPA